MLLGPGSGMVRIDRLSLFCFQSLRFVIVDIYTYPPRSKLRNRTLKRLKTQDVLTRISTESLRHASIGRDGWSPTRGLPWFETQLPAPQIHEINQGFRKSLMFFRNTIFHLVPLGLVSCSCSRSVCLVPVRA